MEQGLGHQPEEDIPDGSMAVFCPACPQPGVNLPPDWKTRYKPYVMHTESYVHLHGFTICRLLGTSLFGHSSWMATSLQSI